MSVNEVAPRLRRVCCQFVSFDAADAVVPCGYPDVALAVFFISLMKSTRVPVLLSD